MASGPIVRTGTTPKFWENYGRIFGEESGDEKKSATKAKATKKKAKKKKKK